MEKALTEKRIRLLRDLFVCITLATRVVCKPFLPALIYNLFMVVFLSAGILLGLYLLLKRINFNKIAVFGFAAILPFACLLSLLLSGTYTSLNGLLYAAVNAYLALMILSLPATSTLDDMKRTMTLSGLTLTILCMPFQLLALFGLVSGRTIPFPTNPSYIGIVQDGLITDRLRVIYHPNITSQMALIIFCFCIWFFLNTHRKPMKVLSVLIAIIQILVIAHAQSRTVYICFSMFAAGTIAHCVCQKLNKHVLIAVIGTLLAVVLFFMILNGLSALFDLNVSLIGRVVPSAEAQESYVTASGQFNVESSLRVELWKTGLAYLKLHPKTILTGIGAKEPTPVMKLDFPEIDLFVWPNLHNALFSCLFRFGLLYFLAAVGMILSLIPACIRCFFRKEDKQSRGFFLIPLMIAALLLASTMEESLIFSLGIPNVVFFLFAGIVVYTNRIIKNKER